MPIYLYWKKPDDKEPEPQCWWCVGCETMFFDYKEFITHNCDKE